MAPKPDYYTVLGISRYASQDEITEKYNQLIAQNPDQAQREQIEAAYAVLSDLGQRQRYDFDQSLSRIGGSYSDYVAESEDKDPDSPDSGTTLDHLMAQSRQSLDNATANIDEMLTGAAAISGQYGSALDDLLADPVDPVEEPSTTLDDLMANTKSSMDDATDAATTLEDLLTESTVGDDAVEEVDSILDDALADSQAPAESPPVDRTPSEAVRSRHPAASREWEPLPGRSQARPSGRTVSVPGTTRRRPPSRRKSPIANLSIVIAFAIMTVSVILVMIANQVDEVSPVFPTMAPFYTWTPLRLSTVTAVPPSETPVRPTAAVTRIQSEGNLNSTVPPEPTEGPLPTELAFTATAQTFDNIMDVIMAAYAQGVPVSLAGLDLSDEVMPAAPLEDAILEGTDFRNANLNAADMRNASLVDANLQGATLRKTSLQGADLTGANLENALLTGTYFSTETILPDGTFWSEDTDMDRFTDPNHPDFWRPE